MRRLWPGLLAFFSPIIAPRVVGIGLVLSLCGSTVPAAAQTEPGTIWTVIGTGSPGAFVEGSLAIEALLTEPTGLALDGQGRLYVADQQGFRVIRVEPATGRAYTYAGNGIAASSGDGGLATAASVLPFGLAFDSAGHLYIAEGMGNRVRKVDATTGQISTVAGGGNDGGDGGLATAAYLNFPTRVVVDNAGNLFIAERYGHRVRRVDAATGIITSVVGNGTRGSGGDGGPATLASVDLPMGLALDAAGNLFIADHGNHRVRRIDAVTGIITTVAGVGTPGYSGDGGPATSASLHYPFDVWVDSSNRLVVADTNNHRIRAVDTQQVISTVAGNGGYEYGTDGLIATQTSVSTPYAVVGTADGHLLVAEGGTYRVRRINAPAAPVFAPGPGLIGTVAGTGVAGSSGDGGPATAAALVPWDVAQDASGNVFVADVPNHRVRLVNRATGVVTTLAGTGTAGYSGDGGPAHLAQFNYPISTAVDDTGHVFVADSNNHRVRRIDGVTGVVTTVAGTGTHGYSGDGGPATDAMLGQVFGIAVGPTGDLFIADHNNFVVRKVSRATGIITTYAGTGGTSGLSGDGGPATAATLQGVGDVAVDGQGNVYILDYTNGRIRKVTASTGIITTVAGGGTGTFCGDEGPATAACLFGPNGVAADAAGNLVIGDSGNERIRYVRASTGIVTTIAGTGIQGYNGDGIAATTAALANPMGVSIGADGTICVADNRNYRVRAIGARRRPVIMWPSPAEVLTGTALSAAQLNATAGYAGNTVPGTFAYTPAAGSVLPAGTHTLSTVFTPTDTTTYETTTAQVQLVVTAPVLVATPSPLVFAGVNTDGALAPLTPAQTVTVDLAGASAWTATTATPWLQITGGTGAGAGAFTVAVVNPGNVLDGVTTASGTVTITAPGAANTPVTVAVALTLHPAGTLPPFGVVDAPAQHATGVQGTIGITGWALDDVGVAAVQVYRACLPAFEPAVNCAAVAGRDALVYVGDATLVSGARPDVEAIFSTTPLAQRAAWGYLLMTNLLPHVPHQQMFGGQGALTFHVLVTDVEGQQIWLGRTTTDTTPTTVTLDNDTIAKPFGAIDTPGQGERTSGAFWNFGWTLTPDTNTAIDPGDIRMPVDGSTTVVFIDGLPQGTVTYDLCRGTTPTPAYCDDDIGSIFGHPTPQPTYTPRTENVTVYRNLDAGRGAIAARFTDTTQLANGIHTIAWSATDSAARGEGIGSRYFWVLNAGGRPAVGAAPGAARTAAPPAASDTEVRARTGFDLETPLVALVPDAIGGRHVRLAELGRLELVLGPVDAGALDAQGVRHPLPVGSYLDPATGTFTWMPGVGHHGTYRLVFARGGERIPVSVTVEPRMALAPGAAAIRMHLDTPQTGATVGASVAVAGWALDPQADIGAGIDRVHVWAQRTDAPGTAPVFLGEAALGLARPDVAQVHGASGARAGFSLMAGPLAPGSYDITAYVWNRRTARWEDARTAGGIVVK